MSKQVNDCTAKVGWIPEKEQAHTDCSTNILQEADHVVSDRQVKYGTPEQNLQRIAEMWGALTGIRYTPRTVGLMLIALKLARDTHKPLRDNLVDIAGYARVIELLEGNHG